MDTTQLSRASSEPQRQLIASPWHTLMVLVIAALNAFRAAIYANRASRTGDELQPLVSGAQLLSSALS